MLPEQAKTTSKSQAVAVAAFLQRTRYPIRNRVIFLLLLKAGLRAKEIALLTWDMLTDADGNLAEALHLRDETSKGTSGRVVPLNQDLGDALQELHRQRGMSGRGHSNTPGCTARLGI